MAWIFMAVRGIGFTKRIVKQKHLTNQWVMKAQIQIRTNRESSKRFRNELTLVKVRYWVQVELQSQGINTWIKSCLLNPLATIDPHKMGYVQYCAGSIAIKYQSMRNVISYFAPYVFEKKTAEAPDMLGSYILAGSISQNEDMLNIFSFNLFVFSKSVSPSTFKTQSTILKSGLSTS